MTNPQLHVPEDHRRGITVEWTRTQDKRPQGGDVCLLAVACNGNVLNWNSSQLDSSIALGRYHSTEDCFNLLGFNRTDDKIIIADSVTAWAKFNLDAVNSFMWKCRDSEESKKAEQTGKKCSFDTLDKSGKHDFIKSLEVTMSPNICEPDICEPEMSEEPTPTFSTFEEFDDKQES